MDIINEYNELFSSVPGVARIEEFQIRTDNAARLGFPPEWYSKLIKKK